MLTDPHHLHLAIIDIAFAVGFGDVSHFNRMFRRYFGETPSGVRATSTMRKHDPATKRSKDVTNASASGRQSRIGGT
jgi:AraC-like DNA-binding protein